MAAIGAVGAVLLQLLHAYLSYRRDLVIRAGVIEADKKIVKVKEGVEKTDKKIIEVDARTVSMETELTANTKITKDAGVAAKNTATKAASAAAEAKSVVESINHKLNGGINDTVTQAIEPIQRTLAEHAAADEKNVTELRQELSTLTTYVHEKEHALVNALQVQDNKLELLLRLAKHQPEKKPE